MPEMEPVAEVTSLKTRKVTTNPTVGDIYIQRGGEVDIRGVKGGDVRRAVVGSCLACHVSWSGVQLVVCRQLPTYFLACHVWRAAGVSGVVSGSRCASVGLPATLLSCRCAAYSISPF